MLSCRILQLESNGILNQFRFRLNKKELKKQTWLKRSADFLVELNCHCLLRLLFVLFVRSNSRGVFKVVTQNDSEVSQFFFQLLFFHFVSSNPILSFLHTYFRMACPAYF